MRSYHGVATHYLHSSSLDGLSERLAELQFKDYVPLNDRYKTIAATIAEFDSGLPSPRPKITGSIRRAIDTCFAHDSPLKILADLDRVRASTSDEALRAWAERTVATIRERSPIGVAVTLQALRLGRNWNIAQAFSNEHEISRVFMRHPDFTTGVDARLVKRSKDRPLWSPSTLEDVRDEDVAPFFAGCNRPEKESPLTFWSSGPEAQYKEYPHAFLALPTDAEIEAKLVEGKSGSEVVAEFLKEKNGKVGVREKVEEVLERLRG
jgi:3-hydroxyisobutyryl-CoA hydrolase